MSLFIQKNVSTREIESWKGFADSLKSEEDKKLFLEMLQKCQKYALAINAKGDPFPTEPLIMLFYWNNTIPSNKEPPPSPWSVSWYK